MVLVPTGTPIYENVAAGDLHPPTVLEMLSTGGLTGYARFYFERAEAFLLFNEGKLSDAIFEAAERRVGTAALDSIFSRLATGEGRMFVFRLSKDLAKCVQALLQGEVLFEGQALGILDIKGILARMKARSFTGCLRIYTGERTALIFYKQGTPLGFFHDGSQEIETSPSESQNIARLPGAKLDALATRSTDELVVQDLLTQVDLRQLWKRAEEEQKTRTAEEARKTAEADRQRRLSAAAALEAALAAIVIEHLGKMGRQVFEKVLEDRIGTLVVEFQDTDAILGELEQAARLLTSASKTRSLLESVRGALDDHARW